MKTIVCSLIFSLSCLVHAEEPTSIDFGKTIWVSNKVHPSLSSLKVDMRSEKDKVNVEFKSASKFKPRQIEIIFTDKEGKQSTLELSALNKDLKELQTFQGSLSSSQQSFVGFQIKIPFTKTKHTIIKSNELKTVK